VPKIVDHDARREEIAYVTCRVVAEHGFDRATVARIAKAAGYTTGMIAHYYDSKREILLASLRLMLTRVEARLTRRDGRVRENLADVLAETLPVDPPRFIECAFWMAFWGQVPTDRKLRSLNAWIHREYMRLYARCLTEHWPEYADWPKGVREAALRSVVTFINGLTASAVTSPADWPEAAQRAQLRQQLDMLQSWARSRGARAVARPARLAANS
jgi:AcrR family transcriptional regulator